MFVAHDTSTVILHVPPARLRDAESGNSDGALLTECELQHYRWYAGFLAGPRHSLLVLLPACWRMAEQRLGESFGPHPICWYEDAAELPPEITERRQVWIVSAQQAPIIDWAAAEALARKREVDILLFGSRPSRSQAHYSESVVVDHDGRVLRFRRHYFDSSAVASEWSGSPGFMSLPGRHSASVVNHLVAHGWSMECMGALALGFRVAWADEPCVLGAGRSTEALPLDAAHSQIAAQVDSGDARAAASPGWPRPEVDDAACSDDDPTYRNLKRLLDVTAAALGLLVLSPLLLLTAMAIKLTSRGPILFGHRRQGLGGREFTCWKFRSMKAGADALQAKLRSLNEVDGPQFKIKADPRITLVGAFIRKTNIDELPQLINVLLGQMSLVGPRPSPDRENQLCPAWRRARLSVKPGITGLWQVLRRRDEAASDFQEWIYYDVEYARHRSLWLDVRVLLYTPVAILAPRRASALAVKLGKFGVCAYSPRIKESRPSTQPDVNSAPDAQPPPVANAPQALRHWRTANADWRPSQPSRASSSEVDHRRAGARSTRGRGGFAAHQPTARAQYPASPRPSPKL